MLKQAQSKPIKIIWYLFLKKKEKKEKKSNISQNSAIVKIFSKFTRLV